MSVKRKWLRNLLLACAVLGALLALGVAFLLYVDHGYLKPEVERRLTQALGRQVSINGILHLRIGNTTRIVVNGLQVASEPWTASPHLLEVRRITLTIDTLSVLAGPVQVDSLVIVDARVALE